VFVVDKVPLCNQQAEVLKMAFEGFGRGDLDVKTLHGGLRCPDPTEYDVLVAVAESFCQHLESNRLGITMFSLVVIDEIHHAVR
jgi:replicative superfamily II helicase